jgi:hypothetical protein
MSPRGPRWPDSDPGDTDNGVRARLPARSSILYSQPSAAPKVSPGARKIGPANESDPPGAGGPVGH